MYCREHGMNYNVFSLLFHQFLKTWKTENKTLRNIIFLWHSLHLINGTLFSQVAIVSQVCRVVKTVVMSEQFLAPPRRWDSNRWLQTVSTCCLCTVIDTTQHSRQACSQISITIICFEKVDNIESLFSLLFVKKSIR